MRGGMRGDQRLRKLEKRTDNAQELLLMSIEVPLSKAPKPSCSSGSGRLAAEVRSASGSSLVDGRWLGFKK